MTACPVDIVPMITDSVAEQPEDGRYLRMYPHKRVNQIAEFES